MAYRDCYNCDGEGYVNDIECQLCSGSGLIKKYDWEDVPDADTSNFGSAIIYGEGKATEKAWSQMSPDERMDEFEYVGLSGIHFNEDHEENWAEYNYGDTDWNSLTPKMQDQLTKRGITEKYSKATENPFVGKNWVADDTPEQDDILGGRTIEEYLQEYNMTREEGERVASYAGMGLEELIQVGNFGEAKYHMDSDYNDAMMFESKATEEIVDDDGINAIWKCSKCGISISIPSAYMGDSPIPTQHLMIDHGMTRDEANDLAERETDYGESKATEDLSDFVRECPECGEKISIDPNAYNQVVAGTGFDAGDHLYDHLVDKHGYSMDDAERATEGGFGDYDIDRDDDFARRYKDELDSNVFNIKYQLDDPEQSVFDPTRHDEEEWEEGLWWQQGGEGKAKEEYINTLDYFNENDNCRLCGERVVGSTQYTHLQKQHGINEELGGFGDFTNAPMGSWENKKSKEFNIGSTMICPICNKEIDVGNDEQYFGHDNTFHDSGTVPFAYKMEDHIADAHTPEEAGVEPWVYADGGSPPNGWMGNNQYQAFNQNFPEYSQDDAEMMNVSGRDDSYTSSGKRSSDKYKYGLDDGSDDYLFDEFGNFQ